MLNLFRLRSTHTPLSYKIIPRINTAPRKPTEKIAMANILIQQCTDTVTTVLAEFACLTNQPTNQPMRLQTSFSLSLRDIQLLYQAQTHSNHRFPDGWLVFLISPIERFPFWCILWSVVFTAIARFTCRCFHRSCLSWSFATPTLLATVAKC